MKDKENNILIQEFVKYIYFERCNPLECSRIIKSDINGDGNNDVITLGFIEYNNKYSLFGFVFDFKQSYKPIYKYRIPIQESSFKPNEIINSYSKRIIIEKPWEN